MHIMMLWYSVNRQRLSFSPTLLSLLGGYPLLVRTHTRRNEKNERKRDKISTELNIYSEQFHTLYYVCFVNDTTYFFLALSLSEYFLFVLICLFTFIDSDCRYHFFSVYVSTLVQSVVFFVFLIPLHYSSAASPACMHAPTTLIHTTTHKCVRIYTHARKKENGALV